MATAKIALPLHAVANPKGSADDLQIRTRKARGFSQTEADLPQITPHTSFKPSGTLTLKQAITSALRDIFSYLGPYNPSPVPVEKTNTVWLLDNVAFPGADGKWHAEYVAAVFAQEPSCTVVDAVKLVADKLGLDAEDKAIATIQQRMLPFLQDILPGRQVTALHGADVRISLGPGGRNGISSNIRHLPEAPAGMLVPTTAEVPTGADGILQMKTMFSNHDGWAIVSDIDDTIKVTQTSDPIGILKTTFVDEPTPVKGMPELYSYIQSQVTVAAPFFYLSASPYNLYPFLHGFRKQHYPHGMLILRDASWMTVPGLLSNLTLGTQEYKVDRMKKVNGWLPRKKLICIGDSTQSDPEAYGEIYRTFPDWIKVILIRKVTDIASLGLEEKNEPSRFEKAFEGVPQSVWHVFEDPSECYKIVEEATA